MLGELCCAARRRRPIVALAVCGVEEDDISVAESKAQVDSVRIAPSAAQMSCDVQVDAEGEPVVEQTIPTTPRGSLMRAFR